MHTVDTLTVAQQTRGRLGQHAASDPVTFGNEIRRLMAERRVGLRELARQSTTTLATYLSECLINAPDARGGSPPAGQPVLLR
jgi:hypothetical protein